jgi:hypothetical protein
MLPAQCSRRPIVLMNAKYSRKGNAVVAAMLHSVFPTNVPTMLLLIMMIINGHERPNGTQADVGGMKIRYYLMLASRMEHEFYRETEGHGSLRQNRETIGVPP